MATNDLPLQQKLHIRSETAGGWLYASANDLKEGDHVVELSPVRSDDLEYLWTIIPNPKPPVPVPAWEPFPEPYPSTPPPPEFFIKNEAYGFMFAADSDVEDDGERHFVECNTTYDPVQNGGDKWTWNIQYWGGDRCSISNKLYGSVAGFDSGRLEGKSVQAYSQRGGQAPLDWILEIP